MVFSFSLKLINKMAKKQTIITFLQGNNSQLNTTKVSALARKENAKDVSATAKRYFAVNAKRSNALNDLIESFKTKLFTELKTDYSLFIAKEFILQTFVNHSELDNFKCINRMFIHLQKQFTDATTTKEAFVKELKALAQKHVTSVKTELDKKLGNLSDKAKAVYKNNEIELIISTVKAADAKAKTKTKIKTA